MSILENLSPATKAKADELAQRYRDAGATKAAGDLIITKIVTALEEYRDLPQATAHAEALCRAGEAELLELIVADIRTAAEAVG